MCFKETCVFHSIFPEILVNLQYYKKSFFLNVTFGGYFCTGDSSDKCHPCHDQIWSPWTFLEVSLTILNFIM